MNTRPKKRTNATKRNKKGKTRFVLFLVLATIVITLIVTLVAQQYFSRLLKEKSEQELPPIESEYVPQEEALPPIEPVEETEAQEDVTKSNESRLALYYIKVVDEKHFEPVRVSTTVPFTLSILQASLQELLKTDKVPDGLRSFIPQDSRLNKLRIKDKVAYLDFNESFQFNEYGSLGILAQLHQIVYTCTEFSTIDKVQILINSEQKYYLSGDEGLITVNQPLTREYLQNFLLSFQ